MSYEKLIQVELDHYCAGFSLKESIIELAKDADLSGRLFQSAIKEKEKRIAELEKEIAELEYRIGEFL